MNNIEHRTPNAEHRTDARIENHSAFDVRCSVFGVFHF